MENGIDVILEDEELEVDVQEDFLKGDKGEPGHTPVKGIDYYTEQDKQEIINDLTAEIQDVKDDFNANVTNKTNEFNINATNKKNQFNANASAKITEYNTNASNKIDEYNANAEDLINRVIEAEAENERLKQDLNGLPSGQAEGETIDITDSAEMRFSKLNISGNSKQETREGYNELLNTAKRYTTDKGIIATFKEDGTIIVSGTATGTVDIQLCGEWASTVEQFKLTAGNYKYTSNNTGLKLYLANNTSAIYFSDNEVKALKDYSVTNAFIRIENGVTINSTIKPMLYLYQGTEREYEQYGASPSPEYSSEVESCGDNVNLFDKDSAIKGAYYNSSNVLTTSTTWKYFEFTPKSKRDYTIKSTKYASEVYFVGFDSSGNSTIITNFSSNKVTFNSNDYVKIGYSVHKDDLDNVKLVEGTHVGEYSIYGQGCINEVVCNKNLLKCNANTETKNGVTMVKNSDGSYTFSGTTTAWTTFYLTNNINYKVTKKMRGSGVNNLSGLQYKVQYYKNGSTSLTYVGFQGCIFNEGDIIDRVYVQKNETGITVSGTIFPQLEEGEKVTDYIPHQSQTYTIPTQQPMRAIGDIRDTFIKKNNKWFERHYIARIVLDGTETISAYTYGTNSYSYSIADIEYNTKEIITKCTHFYSVSYTDRTIEKDNFLYTDYASGNKLIFRNTTFSSADDFKAWLTSQYNAGTPVYVDYILATPLDIECTEEQTTILWDIEQNAKTYKNITHMYSTDKVSSNKKVIYKKDIETLLNNLQAIAISNATEEV